MVEATTVGSIVGAGEGVSVGAGVDVGVAVGVEVEVDVAVGGAVDVGKGVIRVGIQAHPAEINTGMTKRRMTKRTTRKRSLRCIVLSTNSYSSAIISTS
jgi:hypothetical protein